MTSMDILIPFIDIESLQVELAKVASLTAELAATKEELKKCKNDLKGARISNTHMKKSKAKVGGGAARPRTPPPPPAEPVPEPLVLVLASDSRRPRCSHCKNHGHNRSTCPMVSRCVIAFVPEKTSRLSPTGISSTDARVDLTSHEWNSERNSEIPC